MHRRPRPSGSASRMVVGAVWSRLALAAVALLSRLRPSPRGSPRTIPLTSLPGKERDPSFSPDGGRIAFGWDGEKGDNEDIYVKVIGTEVPLRLTTNPAARRYPVWSSDGRHIAFVRSSADGSGLFVIPALGGPERKIHSRSPSFGRCRRGRAGLPTGSSSRSLTKGPDPPAASSSLSLETLKKRKLTSPPPGAVGDFAPAFSPDGRTIAFNRMSPDGGIHVVPAAGGDPKRVTLEQYLLSSSASHGFPRGAS